MNQVNDIAEGEVVKVQGSAAKPYELKNVGGVYSCSCPAWRNQSVTIEKRTCKHLRKIRGEQAETERVGRALPVRQTAASKEGAPVLLAQTWDPAVDITGWWLSEKLDGVRAYWTGKMMLSRLGNEYMVPQWFAEGLGSEPLDGELWMGRGQFQRTVSIVRRGDRSEAWRDVKYLIFDMPRHPGNFEQRMSALSEAFSEPVTHICVVEQKRCDSTDEVVTELARIEALGGEGLMARQPGSAYVTGRSSTLLKIKSFHDDDAIVIGHTKGKGRHKGRVGALRAELRSGVQFSVGTGLSDAQRDNPPPIGSIIVVRYQELTRDDVPRFPSFVGVRDDVKWDGRVVNAPSACKEPSAPAQSSSLDGAVLLEYLEYRDGTSQKFWQVSLLNGATVVRYGRIGANGTVKLVERGSEKLARAAAEKLIAAKKRKGYQVSS